MDFGFAAQKSKDANRFGALKGNKGQTCYLLIKDMLVGAKYGEAL